MMKNFLACLLLILGLTACKSQKTKQNASVMDENKLTLFVGTYTRKEGHVDGQGEGIYVYEMDKETGALGYVSTSESIISPSYLAVHPNNEWIYAVNEYDGGATQNASVTALRYDKETRALSFVTEAPSMGQYPCYISIDNTGKFVMAANYVGGSVVLYPIEEDGAIADASSYKKHKGSSSHPRQEAPHAHMIVQHPTKNWVFAVDLGADRIYEYQLDSASQTLNAVADYPNSPRMSGPRHIAFHPTKEIVYTLNELTGMIETLLLTDTSHFRRSLQIISTLSEDDRRDAASAAIKVHPSGKFVYVSNRGEVNDIAVFSVEEDGTLATVGRQSTYGKTPRDFEIDPTGRFMLVANQDSNNVITFRINQTTGMLEDTGIETEIPTPVCLKFMNP